MDEFGAKVPALETVDTCIESDDECASNTLEDAKFVFRIKF